MQTTLPFRPSGVQNRKYFVSTYFCLAFKGIHGVYINALHVEPKVESQEIFQVIAFLEGNEGMKICFLRSA